MYADPSLIREHVVKLSFNDREADLVKQAAGDSQLAVYAREAILRAVKRQMRERGVSMTEE